jgi:hypothetical protein
VGWYATEEIDQAVKLYGAHAKRNGLSVSTPDRHDSEFDGSIVFLRSGRRELARYRVGADGRLRKMTPRRTA